MVDHMAGQGLKQLTGRIHFGNAPSEALLLPLHFEQEGCLRSHVSRQEKRLDCKVFWLLL